MRIVGAHEARRHMARLLDEVESGHSVTIARHGKPVAKLIPVPSSPVGDIALVEAFKAFAARHTLRGVCLADAIKYGRR
ncbi:MAG: type II toxin-antitoxin system Phd/YefM family antitoxin [Thermoanaerobaculaceae bacterium]